MKSFFQILDLCLVLESDSARFADLFERDYHRFRTAGCGGRPKVEVSVRLRNPSPSLTIDGRLISLKGHPEPEIQAYRLVLEALFAKLDNFLLLHAGAVVDEGGALIVAGPPRSGKSTLVLELVKRGFAFYSDDICPLHRESGHVHPFPRSPWAEPAGCGTAADQRGARLRGGKHPVALADSDAGVDAAPFEARCLVCLDPDEPPPPLCTLTLTLKEDGAAQVVDALRAKGSVTLEKAESTDLDWFVRYPTGRGLTAEIGTLLDKHRKRIWSVFRNDAVSPDFSRTPLLEPISTDSAAFRLLRDLKQPPPRAWDRRDESGGESPGRLFVTLNGLIRHAACYRLRVGRLDDIADLIVRAFETGR